MRKTIFKIVPFLIVLLFVFPAQSRYSREFINQYDIFTKINKDGSFEVTEEIEYDFGGARRHGIFRNIPVLLRRETDTGFGKVMANYRVHLHLLEVTDDRGKSQPYHVSYRLGDLVIRIGSKHKWVSGRKVYKIRYLVRRAINEFKDSDEFYWNFVGTQWDVPIEKVNIHVSFPRAAQQVLKHVTYQGSYGVRDEVAGEIASDHYMVSTEKLRAREGVTTAFSFPKGYLKSPGAFKKLWWYFQDNYVVLCLILAPFLILFLYWRFYLFSGRDPEHDHPVSVQFEPPKDLTPAEVGTLHDEVADNRDITATIIWLATQGYLKIKVLESEGVLFLSNKDYQFVKTKDDWSDLSAFEMSFMSHLFGTKDVVLLSQLREKFYVNISPLKSSLYSGLVAKKFFAKRPDKVRNEFIFMGVVLSILLVGGLYLFSQDSAQAVSSLAYGLSAVSCAFMGWWGSSWMPRKTLKGSRRLREVKGLEEFIKRVETDKIKRMYNEDPNLFGNILAYAMVLGCADRWAEKFDGLMTQPPDWYESSFYHTDDFRFGSRAFVSEMGQGLVTMEKAFVAQPSNSGSGGSSAFGGGDGLGGGGFSGGGFGGGGGGSW